MSAEVDVDEEGFLRNLAHWSAEMAATIASNDEIQLTDEHWEIIQLVRNYYHQHRISPPARVIVKLLKDNLGPARGNSIYLMGLFTGRPARMVNKIAGLPKPTNCD